MSSKIIVKLMNIASFGTIETLQHFLKRHSIELTEKQITRIEKLVTDLDTYTTEENKNSKVIVYTYLAADIESLWKEYGVNVFTKPLSWSGRVIKRHADEITKKLDERWEKTFYELDKLVLSLQTDPTSDQLLYAPDEDVLDLKKRDSMFAEATESKEV